MYVIVMYVIMYVMYTCMYTYIHMCIYIHTHIPYCLSYLSNTILKVIRYKMVLRYTHKKIITNFTDI